jgi:hypothetical protein
VGGSAEFALGHPEKVIDFGYGSEHEMTLKSKAIISALHSPQLPTGMAVRRAGGRR